MHAFAYRESVDPQTYWVSEKLDGVRAFWDGKHLQFRSGALIAAPDWFTQGLPAQALDGELWIDRGRFEALISTVRSQRPDDEAWGQVKYMIFDLPGHPEPFSVRVHAMRRIVAKAGVPWLRAVEQKRVPDRKALKQLFRQTVAAGGEGLMLHRADALWAAGRSDALLKYVPWLDAEATVLSHLPGKGRHAGALGALQVQMPDGRTFRIGSGFTDAQRRDPPPPGTVVTYRYRELTAAGLPRFPRFLRVREVP